MEESSDARPANLHTSQPFKIPERPQNSHYVPSARTIVISVSQTQPILRKRENVKPAQKDSPKTQLTIKSVRPAKILTVPSAPTISLSVPSAKPNSPLRTISVSPAPPDVMSAPTLLPVPSVPLDQPSCPPEPVRAARPTALAAPTKQTAKPVNPTSSLKETIASLHAEPDKSESEENALSAQTTVSDAPPVAPVPSALKDSSPTPRLNNARTAQPDAEFAPTTDHASHAPPEASNQTDPAEKTLGTRSGGPGF